jgi:hypothetical protein
VLGLALAQSAVVIVDYFFGKFFQDITFHASHDEWHHFVMQLVKSFSLVVGKEEFIFFESGQIDLKQLLVVLFEEIFGVEIPGHEEVEEAPKLNQPILDGRSCQYKPMQSFELFNGFEFQCFYIFDQMPLIQNQKLHIDLLEHALILLNDTVSCDEEDWVVRFLLLQDLWEFLLVVDHEYLANGVLEVLAVLEGPMLHQSVRTDDQTVQVILLLPQLHRLLVLVLNH